MSTINIEMIDKINEQLDGLISFLDKSMENLQAELNYAGDSAQAKINEKIDLLSEELTEKLQPVRTKIIDIFKKQYKSALEKIKPIEPILSMFPISISLDVGCLTKIVDALTAIKDIIVAPYEPIIEFTTIVIPKVIELSNKIQTVATYQPKINIPDVTVPPLKVNIPPITASDITSD